MMSGIPRLLGGSPKLAGVACPSDARHVHMPVPGQVLGDKPAAEVLLWPGFRAAWATWIDRLACMVRTDHRRAPRWMLPTRDEAHC